jgi:trans-aconitate methyltransferase
LLHGGSFWIEAREGPTTGAAQRSGSCGQIEKSAGCATGEPIATYLVRHRYPVTGVDSSMTMIELFRERLPNQEALVADMRKLAQSA